MKLPTSNPDSFTQREDIPIEVSEKDIQYGPMGKAAPWASGPLSLHFENNMPFLEVRICASFSIQGGQRPLQGMRRGARLLLRR